MDQCRNGHPKTPANTYTHNGQKQCRGCRREWQRRYRQKLATMARQAREDV